MSSIQSTVDDVEALRFHLMPSRKKVAMVAGVRVERTHVFVDAAGRVYSTQVLDSCYYTLGSNLDNTLEGCRILGLLTKEAVAKHLADSAAVRAKRDRIYAAEIIAEAVKTLGIKLTRAQAEAVEAAKEQR
jgi:hypothetical protein